MGEVHTLNHEDMVLRRTIHVTNVPRDADDVYFSQIFSHFGEVQKVKLDESSRDRANMVFVQFSSEEAAREALRHSPLSIGDLKMRVSPSKTTIDVIPPTDAVFGKPITVGKHVMAVNPSRVTSRAIEKQESAMRSVNQAAARVLQSVSERVGMPIDVEERERLLKAAGSPN